MNHYKATYKLHKYKSTRSIYAYTLEEARKKARLLAPPGYMLNNLELCLPIAP